MNLVTLAETLPLGPGVKVLAAHECGLIALEKPTGILSHPNRSKDHDRSLLLGDYNHEQRRFSNITKEGLPEALFLVNRLDSATSGVILVCTNAEIMPAIVRCFAIENAHKTYLAIARGRPRSQHNVWVDRIHSQAGPGRQGVRVHPSQSDNAALVARTEAKFLQHDDNHLGLSLLRLKPITGRTHQLRFQCAKNHHPILGDANYGDFNLNRRFSKLSFARRMFLHSMSISLELDLAGKTIHFSAESPMPESFSLILKPNPELKSMSTFSPSRNHVVAAQRRRFSNHVPRS